MECLATVTLKRARFFVDQATRTDPSDTKPIVNSVEAAIVFARSVTFHLQRQFAHTPGFKEWYAEQQKRLSNDPLSRFMLRQRNYLLKVGPVSVKRIIGMTITEEMVPPSDDIRVGIAPGKPWYRRSPKVLLEDAINPFRDRVHRWRKTRPGTRVSQDSSGGSTSVVQDALFFTDAEWEDTPALELLNRQLATPEEIVRVAAARLSARFLECSSLRSWMKACAAPGFGEQGTCLSRSVTSNTSCWESCLFLE